jgi:hypothetical protein
MSVREEVYCGWFIKAGCFELVGTDCFITSLLIRETQSSKDALIDLPITHLFFRNEAQGLEATLAQGRFLVDALMGEPTHR